ncbi:outer membrane protein [Oryzibacter oryziterrae]|uniref:outer membrane protein n=1 Tax=Oryzibacter oryziterrae TaxID=2766474 RepID=UPI001F1945FB|nr:outer membrane protein [Oryzibacter oryziterrae]
MRTNFRIACLAGLSFLGISAGTFAVHAADMPYDPPVIEAPEPMPLTSTGGWYLRGDIGYKYYNAPKASISNPQFGNDTFVGHTAMWDEGLRGAFDVGIGAGYQFNDYLRADVTLDYETPAKFDGNLYCPGGCPDGAPNGSNNLGYSIESAKITSWSALANVYADLAHMNGFTPYIGAGAGISYLETSGIQSDSNPGVKYPGAGKTNFAWALMAGVSYALTDQLSLDLGYRYLNLGDAQSGVIEDGVTDNPHSARLKYDNIDAHEVRLGVRYTIK